MADDFIDWLEQRHEMALEAMEDHKQLGNHEQWQFWHGRVTQLDTIQDVYKAFERREEE